MLNNIKTSVALTSLIVTTSAFAGNVAVGQNNKVDLSPIVIAEQSLPIVKIGSDANKGNGVLAASINGGVGVTIPFVNAEAKLGSASIGPKQLNVTVGNSSSVTLGPVKVGQDLPKVNLLGSVNKDKWFNIRIKNGLGVTLPFVSVDVPYPTIGAADHHKKTEVKAPTKK